MLLKPLGIWSSNDGARQRGRVWRMPISCMRNADEKSRRIMMGRRMRRVMRRRMQNMELREL